MPLNHLFDTHPSLYEPMHTEPTILRRLSRYTTLAFSIFIMPLHRSLHRYKLPSISSVRSLAAIAHQFSFSYPSSRAWLPAAAPSRSSSQNSDSQPSKADQGFKSCLSEASMKTSVLTVRQILPVSTANVRVNGLIWDAIEESQ